MMSKSECFFDLRSNQSLIPRAHRRRAWASCQVARRRAKPAPCECRFKACPVQSNDHLLRCDRCIELTPIPVRARKVGQASDYAWSCYAANARGASDPLV